MRLTLVVVAGALGALWGQLDVDCAPGPEARQQIGRTRLSEIEQAEDAGRAALGETLARCPRGEGGAICRAAAHEGFEVAWRRQKAEIEARYRALLREFDARCAGLLAGEARPAPPGVQSLVAPLPRTARSKEETCAESSFSESGRSSCGSSPTRPPAPARS